MTDDVAQPLEGTAPPAPPKVDLETLVLRARPARAIRFKRSVIVSLAAIAVAGVGTEWQFSGQSDLVQALRQSMQQNASRAGDQLTSRNLQVQPTITVRPGAPIRLVVHQDLVLNQLVEFRSAEA